MQGDRRWMRWSCLPGQVREKAAEAECAQVNGGLLQFWSVMDANRFTNEYGCGSIQGSSAPLQAVLLR